MDQTEKWIKIAESINDISFEENNIASVEVEGKRLCIAKTKNDLKACSAKCPHAGSDLSDAFLDKKENIVCPLHGYRFSLSTGRDSNNEGYFLKIYELKQTIEGIFIKLE